MFTSLSGFIMAAEMEQMEAAGAYAKPIVVVSLCHCDDAAVVPKSNPLSSAVVRLKEAVT
jgi:hypothetical protein